MAYYDKATSDALKAKFADLAKPTGADFSSLVDYIDSGLQALDGQTTTTTTTAAPTTTTTTTAAPTTTTSTTAAPTTTTSTTTSK